MDVVERDETPVLFVATQLEPDAIRRAWDELETAVGSLRGRKFYGVFDPETHEYRACVQADDNLALEFPRWTIPGGKYARTKLHGDPPAVYGRIAPAVAELESRVDADKTRPVIEFYRRSDEIHVLVPVQ